MQVFHRSTNVLSRFTIFGGLFVLSFGWFGARYPMLSPRLAADAVEREHH